MMKNQIIAIFSILFLAMVLSAPVSGDTFEFPMNFTRYIFNEVTFNETNELPNVKINIYENETLIDTLITDTKGEDSTIIPQFSETNYTWTADKFNYEQETGEFMLNESDITIEFEMQQKRPSLFTVDYDNIGVILVIILLVISAILLFILGYPAFTSVITVIIGFTFLLSGVNILLSVLVIIIGTFIAFIPRKEMKGGNV